MVMEELTRSDDDKDRERTKWIGVYIALLAVLLAICSMGGGNTSKNAAKANLDATNIWAFFQAKNLRRTHYMMWRDGLERQLAEKSGLPNDVRARIEKDLADYKSRIAHFTSDKKRNEGLDELFVRAKAFEKIRDEALMRDPYFDFGLVFFQIAIVLASVAIVTGGGLAIILSLALGGVGSAFMVNGFYMVPELTKILNVLMVMAGG